MREEDYWKSMAGHGWLLVIGGVLKVALTT